MANITLAPGEHCSFLPAAIPQPHIAEMTRLLCDAGEKIKELRVWTDPASAVIQGIHMLTSTPKELDGRPAGLLLTSASVTKRGAELGTAILLGVAAAEKPGSKLLSAISFTFLVVPTSSAISVDMPNIDLTQLKLVPKVDVKTSMR